jgi:conserved oligomeric Golgi complex subunit 6
MQSICKQVKGIVSDRRTTPSALISRTESLLNELSVVERKDSIVQRFQQDYQLDANVAETIMSGDVDEAFFEALQRVHTVHENCRSLLHTHHQRAGLELLDSMSSYEETAYERLCKYDAALHASTSARSPAKCEQYCQKGLCCVLICFLYMQHF